MSTEADGVEDTPTNPLSSREPGFESRVFGIWGSVTRYICGVVSVFTMCFIAYLDTITTRISVESGHGWPSEWHFFIMTVGVTLCSLSFSNANKTISTILGSGDLREKAKEMLLSRLSKTPAQTAGGYSYYWWNDTNKTFLVLSTDNDLSASGFVRVPTIRPDNTSEWDAIKQAWVSVDLK